MSHRPYPNRERVLARVHRSCFGVSACRRNRRVAHRYDMGFNLADPKMIGPFPGDEYRLFTRGPA
ncbi:hypothetical protein ABZ845_04255 [Streptomyces sp. NPDC047022]|uniref:hypothetical protein n=1 Tax=Streptomyces sp. NPDC047022 TaxID=3155737 RepID=UPI0033ED1DB4